MHNAYAVRQFYSSPEQNPPKQREHYDHPLRANEADISPFISSPGSGLGLITVSPCRIMDTRNANGPLGGPFIGGGATRIVPIPSSTCGIPASASAYSLNFTVVPKTGTLSYLSVWPAGQAQPFVSTLNSLDGSTIANAAVVPAGTAGAIEAFATNNTDLIIDINGYFVPPAANSLQFYPLTPCRVLDTRNPTGTFGGPSIAGGSSRSFPIPSSSCGVPAGAAAYALNVTVVPHGALEYLTAWPTGQAQPGVSTLNSFNGTILANAAIVPAGTNGSASFYASNTTDLVVDINGYFAPPGFAGLNFYALTPCRLVDTRNANGAFGGPTMGANTTRAFPLSQASCGLPVLPGAQAYSLNMTVIPQGVLSYLSTWPAGGAQPAVSTLNAFKGQVVANAAIVPAGGTGSISVYVTNTTNVVIDTNGYFGPGGTSSGAASIQIVSGNSQTANVGQAFTAPLTVKVVDAQGNPLSGITVAWTVSQGSATISTPATPTGRKRTGIDERNCRKFAGNGRDPGEHGNSFDAIQLDCDLDIIHSVRHILRRAERQRSLERHATRSQFRQHRRTVRNLRSRPLGGSVARQGGTEPGGCSIS